MTERLYYEDTYLLAFDGKVTACRPGKADGTWEISLDRSAFYPTSGGQPHDTGTLTSGDGEKIAHVTDVEVDRAGEVWHTVDRSLDVDEAVRGAIDWDRRRDHSEQHGGEHMLAGAIWEKLKGTTIGLHLGREDSSIDVDLPEGRTHLTEAEIAMLEDTVNDRIRMDAPIRAWFPTAEELGTLPLRKAPTVKEHVRVVAMGDFEMVACGGTHPSSTGRIGQIKILSAVPARGKVRVTFVCGERAEKLFRLYQRAADKAGNVLSCPTEKLASSAGELKKRLADAERKLNVFETEKILASLRAAAAEGELKDVTLCAALLPEYHARPLAEAVSAYIAEPGRVLLLWAEGRLTFARSADVNIDMAELIRRVGRGGGRPDLASGAGVEECVATAKKILVTESRGKSLRRR